MAPFRPPSDFPAPVVRAELDRILASEIFARTERLSAFLKFIVERTLAGEAGALKEQVIAVEVYGKGPDFNTAADPIVRVDARRLRDRLREYYAARGPGEVVISVPKGSYTPAFTIATGVVAASGEPVPAPVAPPRVARPWWIAGVVAIAIVVAGAWLANNRLAQQRSESTRLLTVTSFPGAEEDPALSPDGNFVAFSWSERGGPAGDLWIKAVDGDAVRRLTDTTDAVEKYPAWSPDGQQIAFTRLTNGTSSIWLMSALGGPARMIAPGCVYASWLPDGKSLVTVSRDDRSSSSLVQYFLESGAKQTLTQLLPGFLESHPEVSPDGKVVAFNRSGGGRSALFLKVISGGEPTQLIDWVSGVIGGLTWTPNSRDVIYARPEMSGRRLARFSVGSRGAAVPVAGVPNGTASVSTSRPTAKTDFRLAFTTGQPDVGLRLVDLQARGQDGTIGAATEFCDATRMDVPGRFSPNGSQIAFVTDRSGMQQVWLAGRDQSGCRSITALQDATVELGSWSPDGESIAFAATMAGNSDIYVVSVHGGPTTRLTRDAAIEMDPEWSHDGRWIYFASNETGRSQIWKMSADGRTRVQLTTDGGFDPRESTDGRFVYFVTAPRSYGLGPGTKLRRVSSKGGAVSPVSVDVMPGAWGLAGDTVVYLVARAGSLTSVDADVVAIYDIASERVHEVGPLQFRVGPYGATRFLVVSPDGRWGLASHVDSWNRDIFVLDHLR